MEMDLLALILMNVPKEWTIVINQVQDVKIFLDRINVNVRLDTLAIMLLVVMISMNAPMEQLYVPVMPFATYRFNHFFFILRA